MVGVELQESGEASHCNRAKNLSWSVTIFCLIATSSE